MAKVKAAVRNKLPATAFADPENRKFLIHDVTHARLAWQMLDRHKWSSADARSRAKSRILSALRRFGVDTKNYQEHSISEKDFERFSMEELSALDGMLECDFEMSTPRMPCSGTDATGGADVGEYSSKLAAMCMSLANVPGNDSPGALFTTAPEDVRMSQGEDDDDDDDETMAPMLRVPVARMGTWYHPRYGVVSFSQQDFDDMIQNFSNDELGFPPYLRYGHDAGRAGVVDDDPKRGDVVALAQEGPILFSYVTPYDENVVEDVRTKRMQFASAELFRGAESKKDGAQIGTLLKAVSLTNAPFVPNLPAAEVLSHAAGDELQFILELSSTATKGDEVVTTKQETGSPAEPNENALAKLGSQLLSFVGQMFSAFQAEKLSQHLTPAQEVKQDTNEQSDSLTNAQGSVVDHEEDSSAAEGSGETTNQEEQSMSDSNETETQNQEQSAEPGSETSEQVSTGNEGSTTMPDNTLEQQQQADQLVQLSQRLAKLEEQLSVEAEEKAALKNKLTETEAALATTAQQAQAFSTSLASQKREQLKGQLVGEGIPPAMVEQAFSLLASMPQEIRLSNGDMGTAEDQVASLLRALPAENRVKYGQIGQNYSTGAGDNGAYDDIVKARLGNIQK